jgi:hypothetical protein
MVGDRVRELRTDGTDLAPDTPQIVEKPRPFLRELGQELGKPEDVYGLRS